MVHPPLSHALRTVLTFPLWIFAQEPRNAKRVTDIPMDSWMTRMPADLLDTPLYHLAIPGRPPAHF